MKECGRCKEIKTTSEFNKGRGGLSFYCKLCANAMGRKNYIENKDRYVSNAKKREQQLDILICHAKNKPCTDCHVNYPPYVMDFDHLTNKEFSISHMRRRRMAFDKIKAEILKCEIVCANCHRIRTNSRNPSRYTKNGLY